MMMNNRKRRSLLALKRPRFMGEDVTGNLSTASCAATTRGVYLDHYSNKCMSVAGYVACITRFFITLLTVKFVLRTERTPSVQASESERRRKNYFSYRFSFLLLHFLALMPTGKHEETTNTNFVHFDA
jgi:hypothetical protein